MYECRNQLAEPMLNINAGSVVNSWHPVSTFICFLQSESAEQLVLESDLRSKEFIQIAMKPIMLK